MRLWSIDLEYLDSKGLVALWREALLAKNVLEDNTKGYKNHPQLIRFKKSKDPLKEINKYLYIIYLESQNRNFKFNKLKFKQYKIENKIDITKGQIEFEFKHLLKKLKIRDQKKYEEIKNIKPIKANKLFKIKPGKIESWEKIPRVRNI